MINEETKKYIDDKFQELRTYVNDKVMSQRTASYSVSKIDEIYEWKKDVEQGWKKIPCEHNKE